jgi:hypothetical protein
LQFLSVQDRERISSKIMWFFLAQPVNTFSRC